MCFELQKLPPRKGKPAETQGRKAVALTTGVPGRVERPPKGEPLTRFKTWTRSAAPAVLVGATLTALNTGVPVLGVAGLCGLCLAGDRYRQASALGR